MWNNKRNGSYYFLLQKINLCQITMKNYLDMTPMEKRIDELEDLLERLEVDVYSVKATIRELKKMNKK